MNATRWMIAAAALTVAAGRVRLRAGSRAYFVLCNTDRGASAIVTQFVAANPPRSRQARDQAKLSFECAGRDCVLRELWKGGGNGGYRLLGPRLPRGEDTRIAVVALTSAKGD